MRKIRLYFLFLFLMTFNLISMAQATLSIQNLPDKENVIFINSERSNAAAVILKTYLDQSWKSPFSIKRYYKNNFDEKVSSIHLVIENSKDKNSFSINSDENTIYLIAPNEKLLSYTVYTFLENIGFRKFTAKEVLIPTLSEITFPKNSETIHLPSFEYRVLYYPDAFDQDFRDWHKLDWHRDDFSVWGHSFDKLLPAKEFFKTNPEYFAWYEGERRSESLCMTNKKVLRNVIKKIATIISEHPNTTFISVSQNDEAVFCECDHCTRLNVKHGGPSGSLYYFLNKVAKHFPKQKITTLAYQHTFRPPTHLKIQTNIYTLLCPIDLNRGKSILDEDSNSSFLQIVDGWNKATNNLYVWDYTVQFSNYLSPFPNFHTFSDNYTFFQKNNVKGIFAQGYADVPGDLSELRQYLLAKLLWNSDIDIEATTDDFLNGFYGPAAPFVKNYLNKLTENQKRSDRKLDIYSGPIQERTTFLTPKAMHEYDQIIAQAEEAVKENPSLFSRVNKIRLALEYVYFEQSKFYGFERNGMFATNKEGVKVIQSSLTERVVQFANTCNKLGIYELSEEGIAPNKYLSNWLEITKNTATHLGEKLTVNFRSEPAIEYAAKGTKSLVDGIRGHTDYNINWVGWYGINPQIELETNEINFNQIVLHFLNSQRNWIFLPKKIEVFGFKNEEWHLITEKKLLDLEENYTVESKRIVVSSSEFSNFEKIKIAVENQKQLPLWRKRKNKKPMVMLDEIELYNK
ncbi:DUF4838 domain-containing protein [Flavobacterium antarcticum]|uniref:DUF4838 domain-containing protein n=1 Tax=Flavobacterium antarcticum TaxID=271155 RepID=UPI0004287D05|nr:DUF4838 domain-containing protein [Flavobacterium antarcticum]